MSFLKERFGKHLKELRKAKSLTQEQMAEIVGIEPVNISKIERGMHFPQPEKIEKIANALNTDIKELFNFDHIQNKEMLIDYINNTLKRFDLKDIEIVYKFIKSLELYK